MKYLKIIAFAILSVCLQLFSVQAQTTILAAGGDVTTTNEGSVSYSMGQIIYTTISNDSHSIFQGIQIPAEIFMLDINDPESQNPVSCYPNPFSSYLNIKIENINNDEWEYQLYNILGVEIAADQIVNNHTLINTNDIMPGLYFLTIIKENITTQTIKITKKIE